MRKNDRRSKRRQATNRSQLEIALPDLLRFHLQDLVVSAGFEELGRLLEAERTAVCGPRYRHAGESRQAYRFGHAPGELVLGGRKVSVRRPRARTVAGEEVTLPSWKRFSAEDPLQERSVEQMLLGVATRRYGRSLDALPSPLRSRSESKSSVSRRFVSATQAKLEELVTRDLSELTLLELMVDGVHFADHVVLVALGIDRDGFKHVLGLQEGASENSTACRSLLTNLRDRGMRTDRSILVTLDGSKALAKAVRDVFGKRALLQRCQVHKKGNVLDHLPESKRASVSQTMTQAYRSRDAKRSRQVLTNLSRSLEIDHPGAAASIREGLDETLTVKHLKLSDVLERMLSTTNAIENLFSSVRRVSHRVKNWQDGSMILRWAAAGLEEAAKGFRRIRGYKDLPKLEEVLRQNDEKLDGINQEEEAA